MSHFTVMVINSEGVNDVNEQLAPFNENLRIPISRGREVSQEDVNIFIDYYQKQPEVSVEELYKLHGLDWNGNEWKFEDGKFMEYFTYSSNPKWDWYQIGGRWCGFLKVKDASETPEINPSLIYQMDEEGKKHVKDKMAQNVADQAFNHEILWADMMSEGYNRGCTIYDKVAKEVGLKNDRIKQPKLSWKHCIDKYDRDIARKLYNSQETVKALNSENLKQDLGYFPEIKDFNCTREEYANKRANQAISTFAVLKDGEWYERGQMGWWGISTETDEEGDNWDSNFYNNFIKDLPENALITIVDCHI